MDLVGPVAELVGLVAATVGGVIAVVLSFVRKDHPTSQRVYVGVFGAIVAIACGWMIVVWAYVASCQPGKTCF